MHLYEQQTIKIHNSLTGKKEIFTSLNEGNIGMYVCGPTVYSNVHLGNCRTFMSFDMIFRYFRHLGYKVRYVRNIQMLVTLWMMLKMVKTKLQKKHV